MSKSNGFIERLRNILSFSSGNNDNQNSGYKRRADDKGPEYAILTKYRKIDTAFPKVISRPFEGNNYNFGMRPYKHVPDLPKLSYIHMKSNGCKKQTLSNRAKTTYRTLLNSAYADVEFSDDEDDDIILTTDTGIPISPKLNYFSQLQGPFYFKSNENNIPNRENNIIKATLPPLIEVKSGSCVKPHTIMSERKLPRKANVIDLTKMNDYKHDNLSFQPQNVENKYRNQASINQSANHSRNSSIMSQQYKTTDKNNYYHLLSSILPQLYKPDRQDSPIVLSSHNNNKRSGRKKTDSIVHHIPIVRKEIGKPNINEVIELDDDDEKIVSAYNKLEEQVCAYDIKREKQAQRNRLPYVTPVNTFKERIDLTPICKDNWLDLFKSKWNLQRTNSKKEICEVEEQVRQLSNETFKKEKALNDRIREMNIVDPDIVVTDDFPEPIEEDEFKPFSKKEQDLITEAIYNGSQDEVLVSKFNMNITRRDICTLVGSNWLNDEVINFYMNLLTERSNLRSSEGLPKVYAMNTFFIPRLIQSGHRGVARWTRKVDIFAHDILPVPVHVGGVHWCMAIINLRNQTINYYDSMGTPNPKILNLLEQYLRDEHLDKKKQHLDTSDFELYSVPDCPRQMNGSDCGVFSCMFAECLTRNKNVTFSQEHMQYFRNKMIFEIVSGKLMH